jgi:hypothetical protein
MPDWRQMVRQRLSGLALNEDAATNILEELADHLEDEFRSLLRQGATEQDAMRQVLERVGDWQRLKRRIEYSHYEERHMTNRISQLWLPGMLAFVVSMAVEALANRLEPNPLIFSLDMGTPILKFYPLWLGLLPLAGALGAYLSKRMRGSVLMALGSSVFPVLLYGCVFLIAIPVGLVMGHNLDHHVVAAAIFGMGTGWVLLPGTAMLAGGLLVQLLWSRGSTSRSTITG